MGSDDRFGHLLKVQAHPPVPGILSPEAKRRQRLRSIAIAWALFAMAVMFFVVTIVRLGANVANKPL